MPTSARQTAAIAVLALVVSAGQAASQSSERRLVVSVGQTREVDVDYKVGLLCDDLQILEPSMVTRGDHNWFVVEGVAPGKTLCRVGTDPQRPSYVFEVVVEPRRK